MKLNQHKQISTFALALIVLVLGMTSPHIAEARPTSTTAGCDKRAGTDQSSCQTCVGAGGTYDDYKCTKKDGTTVECNLFECDAEVKAQFNPQINKRPVKPAKPIGTVGKPRRRPELIFKTGIYLGGKLVNAGGLITLSKKRAIKIKHGKCVFNTHYKIKNTGPVATPNKFRNRIRVDGNVNSTVPAPANSPGATLNAGITMRMVHNTKLKPGMHKVLVSIDDGNNVSESNESNNKLSFRVKVKGSCKKAGKPTGQKQDKTGKQKKKTNVRSGIAAPFIPGGAVLETK